MNFQLIYRGRIIKIGMIELNNIYKQKKKNKSGFNQLERKCQNYNSKEYHLLMIMMEVC